MTYKEKFEKRLNGYVKQETRTRLEEKCMNLMARVKKIIDQKGIWDRECDLPLFSGRIGLEEMEDWIEENA